MKKFLLLFMLMFFIQVTQAHAVTINIFSNTTDWTESTVIDVYNPAGWPGVDPLDLPDAATFTLTPVAGAPQVDNVAGSTNIFAGAGIRYFRNSFNLPYGINSADIQLSVDNDIQIFINRVDLALEGSRTSNNFSGGVHHRIFVDTDGSVTNGYLGGQSFDSFTNPFFDLNGVEHELILAVRNKDGGDTGGFSFGMEIVSTPEPATMLLLGSGLIGLAGLRRKFRKR